MVHVSGGAPYFDRDVAYQSNRKSLTKTTVHSNGRVNSRLKDLTLHFHLLSG
jgi:hypothetical protein